MAPGNPWFGSHPVRKYVNLYLPRDAGIDSKLLECVLQFGCRCSTWIDEQKKRAGPAISFNGYVVLNMSLIRNDSKHLERADALHFDDVLGQFKNLLVLAQLRDHLGVALEWWMPGVIRVKMQPSNGDGSIPKSRGLALLAARACRQFAGSLLWTCRHPPAPFCLLQLYRAGVASSARGRFAASISEEQMSLRVGSGQSAIGLDRLLDARQPPHSFAERKNVQEHRRYKRLSRPRARTPPMNGCVAIAKS